jgi:hypothetical protein
MQDFSNCVGLSVSHESKLNKIESVNTQNKDLDKDFDENRQYDKTKISSKTLVADLNQKSRSEYSNLNKRNNDIPPISKLELEK